MELPITIALTIACLVVAVFSGWRGAQPPDPLRGVRMVPWRGIMLLAAALLLVLIVRLADQLGLMR
jgi:hypothetical protein